MMVYCSCMWIVTSLAFGKQIVTTLHVYLLWARCFVLWLSAEKNRLLVAGISSTCRCTFVNMVRTRKIVYYDERRGWSAIAACSDYHLWMEDTVACSYQQRGEYRPDRYANQWSEKKKTKEWTKIGVLFRTTANFYMLWHIHTLSKCILWRA